MALYIGKEIPEHLEKKLKELKTSLVDDTLQYNGKLFYYSVSEQKIFTGIEAYKKTYFKKDKISFPLNYPDLIHEYYKLALNKYLEAEKEYSIVMFDDIIATKEFINIEFTENNERIKSLEEFLQKMKHHTFNSKEQLLKYCKRYNLFLKEKIKELDKPQQNISKEKQVESNSEINKNDEVKKELHNNIFKRNAFEIFEKYVTTKKIDSTCRTDLRLLFELLKEDNLLVENIELKHYRNWLSNYFNSYFPELKKIELNTRHNIQRTNDYKEYKSATLK